jgi:hypothetical protein
MSTFNPANVFVNGKSIVSTDIYRVLPGLCRFQALFLGISSKFTFPRPKT